jgi:zinc transporter
MTEETETSADAEFPETDASAASGNGPLLFGFGFDAEGKPTALEWTHVSRIKAFTYPRIWLHLNRSAPQAHAWLRKRSGLDKIVIEALLTEDTRPRALRVGKGFLINLRGFNLNPGDALDDLISVRLWAEPDRLITLRSRPLQASVDVRQLVEGGGAPNSTGGLVALIANALTARMEPEIAEFEEQADGFEDQLLDPGTKLPRSALARFRRRVLSVRRYILPQRDALAQLVREGTLAGLFSEHDLLRLRECTDRVTRLSEDLDIIRERTAVLQEQILEERAEETNKRLFLLSLISAIFMPVSFVAGLFGVNIGGMPGLASPWAFTILCLSLAVLTGLLLLVFRWRRWI